MQTITRSTSLITAGLLSPQAGNVAFEQSAVDITNSRGMDRIGTAKSSAADRYSMILSRKSRAPKCGFWLMRGAQPATSAGARLFAGSPIPAFLTTPKGDEEINLALAGFELAVLRALSGSPAISAKSPHIVV